jgi:hypothetical protein
MSKEKNSLETNVNIIRQWVTFLGVVTLLSIVLSVSVYIGIGR